MGKRQLGSIELNDESDHLAGWGQSDDRPLDPSDNIVEQAASGSVAAIVQVLNQALASDGVRTRAMFENGWLQLLCEAGHASDLDQAYVVDRVRQILEDLDPANVRRVQINSRIAREQQLLWLQDIRRQPKQLLWFEQIHLRRGNPLRRLQRRWQRRLAPMPAVRDRRERASFRHSTALRPPSLGWMGGMAIGVLLALTGFFAYQYWSLRTSPSDRTQTTPSQDSPTATPITNSATPNTASNTATPNTASNTATPNQASSPANSPAADPFAQAVTIASRAAIAGQSENSASTWLDISAQWQRAAELMEQVKPDDARYQTAQGRAEAYRNNSLLAQKKANQR